jgi:ArsR family transcriptional regulator
MDIDTAPLKAPELPVFCCPPLGASALDEDAAVMAAGLFKALADPQRVRIVNLLATAGEPVCVCDIVAAVGLSQPTVSHHLRKLSAVGLLRREQRGVWAYYSVDPPAFRRLAELVSAGSESPAPAGKEAEVGSA